ncbi:hypothetical protein VTL71DRAFT_372 [Oculimacula yallundae]|uniref:DUF962 domain-containing protein n=1 Tax=Oculimacula yallundae TaxID=86028 RepID=A0ABR4CZX3_9HELO
MKGFDLEKQLLFYGAYHHNPVNVGIHMVCVPLLLLTGFQFGSNTPEFLKSPRFMTVRNLPLNLATVVAMLYSTLYITLEPLAGLASTPLLLGAAALANKTTAKWGAKATKVSVLVHAVSWIAQFIGHGKFEGRAPALLDNLVQALFLAPLFVWMELLFKLGYRPALRMRLEEKVRVELERLRVLKEEKKRGLSEGKGEGV